MKRVLGVLGPAEELVPGLLVVMAVCPKESPDYLDFRSVHSTTGGILRTN